MGGGITGALGRTLDIQTRILTGQGGSNMVIAAVLALIYFSIGFVLAARWDREFRRGYNGAEMLAMITGWPFYIGKG